MKKSFIILSILLPFIVTGCSSVYTIKDFPSKQEFYNNFNNAARDKGVETTLLNDTVINIKDGAEILNDTLYVLNQSYHYVDRKIAVREIKDIKYTGIENTSAVVSLKNNEKLQVADIRSNNDTMEFNELKTLTSLKSIVPVDKVKEIKYKNQFTGIFPGVVSGLCLGVIAGVLGFLSSDASYHQDDPNPAIYKDSGIGVLSGGFIGLLIGRNYIYRFSIPH